MTRDALSPVQPQGDALIADFLAALAGNDNHRLASLLSDDAEWIISGLPRIEGRAQIVQRWNKLVARYEAVRIVADRLVADDDILIASQTHVFEPRGGAPISLSNMAVYRTRDARIVGWTDYLDLEVLPREDLAFWRRSRLPL